MPEYCSPAQDSPFYACGERPDCGMGSWIMAQHPGTGVVEEVASPGAFGTFPWVAAGDGCAASYSCWGSVPPRGRRA
jgi:hypothetical protein